MRKGFTLMEVMIAVMVISIVIGVLLQLFSNNTTLFSSMRGHSELCMRSSLLIGNTDYGYENKKVNLADLVQEFDIDDDLRRKLKKYKAEITYTPVKILDTRELDSVDEDIMPYLEEHQNNAQEVTMEIGRSSFQMDEFQTAYLRLKLQ